MVPALQDDATTPVAGWSSTVSARASPAGLGAGAPARRMRTVATAGSVAKANRRLDPCDPLREPRRRVETHDGVARVRPPRVRAPRPRSGRAPPGRRGRAARPPRLVRTTCVDLARRHRHEVVDRDPVEPRLGQQRELGGDGVRFEPELLEAAAVERARRGRVPDERAQPALRRARRAREREDAVEVVPRRQPTDEPVLEREDVDGLEGRRNAVDGLAGEGDLDRDRVAGDVDAVRIVVVNGEVLERADVVRQDRVPALDADPADDLDDRVVVPDAPGSRPSPRC